MTQAAALAQFGWSTALRIQYRYDACSLSSLRRLVCQRAHIYILF
jgi:hypothetical protein